MAGSKKPRAEPALDPFQVWKNTQHPEPVAPPEPDPDRVTLSPERQAIRALAIDAMLDAKDEGDPNAYDTASEQLVALNRQLFLQEIADRGLASTDGQTRATVLRAAAVLVDQAAETTRASTNLAVSVLPDTCIATLHAYARQLEAGT